jgi:ribosome-associated translation inhibitor RaiA
MKLNYILKNIEQDQINFKEISSEKLNSLAAKKKDIDELKIVTKYEKNPKRAKENFKVEIAMFSGGKAVSVEGIANNQLSAFEYALEKIQTIIRKEHSSKVISKK